MKIEIPLIIIGLIVLYIVLSIEPFNVVQEIPKHAYNIKDDLIIKPKFIRGHIPIGSKRPKAIDNTKCGIEEKPMRGSITIQRENISKYIRESMLLNKPNHNLGFLPENVRFMDLMYNKPNQIGSLPIFKGKIPEKIKLAKLTHAEEEEGDVSEEV